jgi:hypothetical protein
MLIRIQKVGPEGILGARAVVKRGGSWTVDLPKRVSELCGFEREPKGSYSFIFVHLGDEALMLIPFKDMVNPKTIYDRLKTLGLADFLSPVDIEKALKELAEE